MAIDYSNHLYLAGKNRGNVRELRGNIVNIIIFVNDNTSQWTTAAEEEYRKEHLEAIRFLKDEAAKRGIPLSILWSFGRLSLNTECTGENVDEWSKMAIGLFGFGSISEYQSDYQRRYSCGQAPVFFVLNKTSRSSASMASAGYNTDEFATVMRFKDGKFYEHTIVHEMMHLFGARDYYYPERVKNLADYYLKDSIMTNGWNIDSLTSYVIGWTNVLDVNAKMFLNQTANYTREMINEEIRKEWRRGW